ncbi:MAG TPA: hypothetical protein VN776_05235 [Terracidiphilus sp.]|nr:hypothetical protein [Terracidiphilus sp.]
MREYASNAGFECESSSIFLAFMNYDSIDTKFSLRIMVKEQTNSRRTACSLHRAEQSGGFYSKVFFVSKGQNSPAPSVSSQPATHFVETGRDG